MAERSRPAPPHLSANRCRPAVLMRNVRRSRPSLQLVSLRERVQRESGGWDRAGAPRSPRARPWRTGCGGCPCGAPGVRASRTHTWCRSADTPWPRRGPVFIHEPDGGHCANNHKIYAKSQPFPLNRTSEASVGSRAGGLSVGRVLLGWRVFPCSQLRAGCDQVHGLCWNGPCHGVMQAVTCSQKRP